MFSKRRGSTRTVVRGFTFDGKLGWVSVTIELYTYELADFRRQVMRAWGQGRGSSYMCKDNKCVHEARDENVLAMHRQEVAGRLGPLNATVVPNKLQDSYEYLMSPFERSEIGSGVCGLPAPGKPVRVLRGFDAIQALVAEQRIDLIANVLRGPNSGGRVYALLALQHLERIGNKLPPDVVSTLQEVLSLDVPLSTCYGCIVSNGLQAREVVRGWGDNVWK
jgi:hypothetical protein